MAKNPRFYEEGTCICGHHRSTHYKETLEVDGKHTAHYTACLGMYCDCKGYLKKFEEVER